MRLRLIICGVLGLIAALGVWLLLYLFSQLPRVSVVSFPEAADRLNTPITFAWVFLFTFSFGMIFNLLLLTKAQSATTKHARIKFGMKGVLLLVAVLAVLLTLLRSLV
jgi:hypothetical protein